MRLVVLKADVRERGMGVYTNLGGSSFSKKKGEDGETGFQSVLYQRERERNCVFFKTRLCWTNFSVDLDKLEMCCLELLSSSPCLSWSRECGRMHLNCKTHVLAEVQFQLGEHHTLVSERHAFGYG